jgi:hypothetical protein
VGLIAQVDQRGLQLGAAAIQTTGDSFLGGHYFSSELLICLHGNTIAPLWL